VAVAAAVTAPADSAADLDDGTSLPAAYEDATAQLAGGRDVSGGSDEADRVVAARARRLPAATARAVSGRAGARLHDHERPRARSWERAGASSAPQVTTLGVRDAFGRKVVGDHVFHVC